MSLYLLRSWCSLAQLQWSCYPKEVGCRGSAMMTPAWVRPFWHLCMTSPSAWQCSPRDAANGASFCPSESFLMAALPTVTESCRSVKVQTKFVAKKPAPAPFQPFRMTSKQTEWPQKPKNRSAIQSPPAFLEKSHFHRLHLLASPRGFLSVSRKMWSAHIKISPCIFPDLALMGAFWSFCFCSLVSNFTTCLW